MVSAWTLLLLCMSMRTEYTYTYAIFTIRFFNSGLLGDLWGLYAHWLE